MKRKVREREVLSRRIIGILLFVLFLFAFSPNAKAAVTGKIAGTVVDAATGEPLPGNVLVVGTDRGAACDVDGYYYILRLEPGTYDVQARMIGYESITKTSVKVISGHTTPINFELQQTVVPGEGVTVQAEREVVKMDLAGSSFAAERADIEAVPLISDAADYLNYQAGIDGWSVRGGGISQTKLMADGLLLVDQRANEPIMMPNLSEIKEVTLIKGGFEAEFANVRSGVINVITREGSADRYEGSFEFRYTPGYQKHSGVSIFHPDNYYNAVYLWNKLDTGYLNPLLDTLGEIIGYEDTVIKYDSICWNGTRTWLQSSHPFYDTIKANTYPAFARGWIGLVRRDTLITPEQRRDLFLWRRRIITEGDTLLPQWDRTTYINTVRDSVGNIISQDTLLKLMPDSAYVPIYDYTGGDTTITGYTKIPWQPKEGEDWPGSYGDLPDWTMDVGFGGPIPVIGAYLGDMSFYASYRDHNEAFALPDSRDYYRERMMSLKLTSRFGNYKVNLRGAYSIVNSLSPFAQGDEESGTYGFNRQVYLRNGMDIIQPQGEWNGVYHGSDKLAIGNLYRADALSPFDVTSRIYGLSLQHALSENTFYDVKLTYVRRNFDSRFYYDIPSRIGGDTVVRWFGLMVLGGGEYYVDNIPYGHAVDEDAVITDIGGANYGATHQLGTWNTSWSQSYMVGFDMTTQLDKVNQLKFGVSAQYDKLNEYWIAHDGWGWPDRGEETTYSGQQYLYNNYNESPIMAGGYIQDKIEFEGMFANIGLRFDYADPNTVWPMADRFSVFFSAALKDSLFTLAPMVEASKSFKISPRVGISFPILERSKLFFNYGHFYSTAPNEQRYRVNYGDFRSPIIFMGNPSLDMERTISYEVGLESSIANTYLARISGYYQDKDNEFAEVRYVAYYASIANYTTVENNGYGDTRGFEFEFRKDHGRFLTGWLNYDYRVETFGQIGKEAYFENPLDDFEQGLVMPDQDRPSPRPVFRAQVTLKSPEDLGLFLGGYYLSFLYSWRGGGRETYMGGYPESYRELFTGNLKWQDERFVDISMRKNIEIAGIPVSLFMDVHNVFDWQTLSNRAFSDGIDRNNYIGSLHLEMYNHEPWLSNPNFIGPAEGEEPDKIGDLRSEEKPYINDPDVGFLYYLDMRFLQFGIRFSF